MAKINPQTAARRADADKAAALLTHASYVEGSSAIDKAKLLQTAFAGYSLGKWDASAKGGKGAFVPSERFNYLYDLDKIGYVAARLAGDNEATTEDARTAKARTIIADRQRGELFNTMLAAHRQSWGRSLSRAGLATPRPKDPPKSKGDKTKAGQGATDAAPSKTVEVDREAAKALPPSKPDRENVVEYIRETLAVMALCIEKANQSAAKTKGKAVPPVIQSTIADWLTTSKAWVI